MTFIAVRPLSFKNVTFINERIITPYNRVKLRN